MKHRTKKKRAQELFFWVVGTLFRRYLETLPVLLPMTYHSIDMVKGDENGKSAMATKWSSADDATLIETLRNEKAKGSWGDNGPKPVVYTEVVKALIYKSEFMRTCSSPPGSAIFIH